MDTFFEFVGRIRGLRPVTRVAVIVWLLVSVSNFVIWATIALVTVSYDTPWWLWSFGPGGILVALIWLIEAAATGPRKPAAVVSNVEA